MADPKEILMRRANRVLKSLKTLGNTRGKFPSDALDSLTARLTVAAEAAVARLGREDQEELAFSDLLPLQKNAEENNGATRAMAKAREAARAS